LAAFAKEIGLVSREDVVGNFYACPHPEPMPPTRKTLLVGSHLDTVRNAGLYDGALGVLAGMVALSTLVQRLGTPGKRIEVAGLVEEEGSRYHSGFIGSRAVVRGLGTSDLKERDDRGIALADAMSACGYDPATVIEAKRDDIEAYLELHIEQGPILERNKKKVGIVESITGLSIVMVEIAGEGNHAGTTPMDRRKDALVAACEVIGTLPETVRMVSPTARATVGTIQAHPGSKNVIPGRVRFSVDIRDSTIDGMEKVKEGIRSLLAELLKELAWEPRDGSSAL
jgi:allantoate deiminase